MSSSAPGLFSLQDRVVILTGAAGLYGRGLASQLAGAGARLVVAARNLPALQKVAEEESARGYTVSPEFLDQGDEESILHLRDRVLARFGRIDGLVNNAVFRPAENNVDSVVGWNESLRVNATGLFLLTRAVCEAMAPHGRGSVVNISSIFGVVGPNLWNYEKMEELSGADYFFNKGGMISLTRYFASIYGTKGVRVNSVSPGGYFNHQDPAFVERYKRNTMLGRMAGDHDLGGPVIFLLSDAAAYVTATDLPIDGGYTAK